MKVSLNINNPDRTNFTGYKWVKDECGFKNFETTFPFDEEKQSCYLEVYTVGTDEFNNFRLQSPAKARNGGYRIKLKSGKNRINLAKTFGILPDQSFAYHYVIKDKDNNEHIQIDAGDSINVEGKSYNVVTQNGSQMSKGGSMKLVNIDTQNVGIVYNKDGQWELNKDIQKRGLDSLKTLTNVYGGTAAGIEKDIESGKFDSYSRIISLPVFTRENFTSHKYWIENIFQPCNDLMNINNYASLQKKMFAHNLNFVSDGAFVNEGLMGTHFTNILRWGTDSPYYRWFRASNLKDAPLSLGVFPKRSENISWKLVNSPKLYVQDTVNKKIEEIPNEKYDPNKPTYIQFFDKRFVSKEEKQDPQFLIKSYSKLDTKDGYDLHTHNDSVFPYYFEVNPQTIQANAKRFNQHNSFLTKDERLKFDEYEAARIMSKNENFVVDEKFESGFETWDANPDIAKLNFVLSNNDLKTLQNLPNQQSLQEEKKILQANYQVQDYAVEGGKYWTRKTDDILRLHIAQQIQSADLQNPNAVYKRITGMANGKIFPKSLSAEVFENDVRNVLNGFYKTTRKLSNEDKNGQILEQLMNMPLESIEFGTNLVGVLGSPLITKRANTKDEIGVPRYDLYKKGNPNLPLEYTKTYNAMDNIYKNEMSDFAKEILENVNKKLPAESKLFDGDKVTQYGQYVLPIIVPQIAKYSIVKSLAPNVNIEYDPNNREIKYDYNELLNTNLQSLNLPKVSSPQDEAMLVLEKLKQGINTIPEDSKDLLQKSILNILKNTNVQSFKLADLIIDKTQSGLDWRIDATKDIADIDALRTHKQHFEDIWNNVTDFWTKFAKGIYSQNPNSYIVAEITDEDDLYDSSYGIKSGIYPKKSDILTKFFRTTGITANAQYSKYYYDIVKLFSKSFEDGNTLDGGIENTNELAYKLQSMLMTDTGSFLKAFSLPAVNFAYTFIGNHDKPRALHCAALDMEMFYSDLTFLEDTEHRTQAYRLVKDKLFGDVSPAEVKNYNFENISPKAVAMGIALRDGFTGVLEDKYKKNMNPDEYDKNFKAICKAVADLSSGKFGDIRFESDAFGTKPIDFNIKKVIEQAKNKYEFDCSKFSNKFDEEVFEAVMRPAMTKVLAMMQILAALPGMPTLYDGDDLGATGYDTKKKNVFLQGRQRVHNEWAEADSPRYRKFIADNKAKFDKAMGVRTNPNCNALNNGAPFVLPMQHGYNPFGGDKTEYNIPAVLQQSTDGRMTISLFNLHRNVNPDKPHYDYRQPLDTKCIKLPAINLNTEKNVIKNGAMGIGIMGLKHNIEFYNANDPNDIYYVNISDDGKHYVIKRGKDNGQITINEPTLVLYSNPQKSPLSFTGQYHIKQGLNKLTKAYSPQDKECGKSIMLCK